jgi:hypothetical protein
MNQSYEYIKINKNLIGDLIIICKLLYDPGRIFRLSILLGMSSTDTLYIICIELAFNAPLYEVLHHICIF